MSRIYRLGTLLRLCMILGGVFVYGPAVFAQVANPGLSTYFTLSTDFPHHGISQTDESAATQIGIDFQHSSGLFVGGWASNVDYVVEGSRAEPRDIEVDFYAGYSRRTEDWSFAATLARYTYPDASRNYDYTELSGSIGFHDRFFYTLGYTGNLLGQSNSAMNHEFGVELPLPWRIEFDASIGRVDSDDVRDGAYDHWNLGFSTQLRGLSLDLRYYDTSYALITHLGAPLHESWVFSLTYTL